MSLQGNAGTAEANREANLGMQPVIEESVSSMTWGD